MLKIEIPTKPLNEPAEAPIAGPVLAQFLRSLAFQVEQQIVIVPTEGEAEWQPEVRRHAARIDGILLGAVYTLEA